MQDNKPSYFAIIPAEVRYDQELPPGARLLYGELTALARAEGFAWASNRYFAELYKRDENTISAWVSALAARGYIRVELSQGAAGVERRIWIARQVGGLPENEEGVSLKIGRPSPEKSGVKRKGEKEKGKEESAAFAASPLRADAERLASLLLAKHQEIDPKFRQGEAGPRAVASWAPDVERLMRLDGRSPSEVEAVIFWCQADEFWRSNILSGAKLREKYPTLVLQMQRGKGPAAPRRGAPPPRRESAEDSEASRAAAAAVAEALGEGKVV